MNKTELIEQMAHDADISKVEARRALDAALAAITKTLQTGGEVSIIGFGKFYIAKREARTGRSPRTGEKIKIDSAYVPKFSAGRDLKKALN